MPPFSVRPAPGRRRGLFANCQDRVGPGFSDQELQGGGEKPVIVTDASREEERYTRSRTLRPVTVNCFICDSPDLAAMQPEIGEFTHAQVIQFADGSPVQPIICEPSHCRVEPRA